MHKMQATQIDHILTIKETKVYGYPLQSILQKKNNVYSEKRRETEKEKV